MKRILKNIIDWYKYDFGISLTYVWVVVLFILWVLLGIPFGWTQVI